MDTCTGSAPQDSASSVPLSIADKELFLIILVRSSSLSQLDWKWRQEIAKEAQHHLSFIEIHINIYLLFPTRRGQGERKERTEGKD
tara:strand:- start:3865 stop:4122 length:258 start_codon:yes stop_codon:yes gene_type:complete